MRLLRKTRNKNGVLGNCVLSRCSRFMTAEKNRPEKKPAGIKTAETKQQKQSRRNKAAETKQKKQNRRNKTAETKQQKQNSRSKTAETKQRGKSFKEENRFWKTFRSQSGLPGFKPGWPTGILRSAHGCCGKFLLRKSGSHLPIFPGICRFGNSPEKIF